MTPNPDQKTLKQQRSNDPELSDASDDDKHANNPRSKAACVAAAPSREIQPGEIPQSFGRCRIVHRLGHGASGVVYRAGDDELRRHVATKVKVTFPKFLSSGTKNSYLAEARTVARLDHELLVWDKVGQGVSPKGWVKRCRVG